MGILDITLISRQTVGVKATSFGNIENNEAYFLISLMSFNWYLVQLVFLLGYGTLPESYFHMMCKYLIFFEILPFYLVRLKLLDKFKKLLGRSRCTHDHVEFITKKLTG